MKIDNNERIFHFFRDNLASIATILAGLIVIIAQSLGWIQSQVVVNSIIISLLCLFAISEILQRTGNLDRIEKGIIELHKLRDGKFTKDIDYVWSKAIAMVKSVKPEGCIFDTTSIKNRLKYEKAIKERL